MEIMPETITEHYENREDKLYYRQVTYARKEDVSKEQQHGNRRPILKIIQKFNRDEEKHADDDIAIRVFAILEREIHIKYHYGKGHVTASTRIFLKPPLAEMGAGMVFRPELTYGYQAEIGAKPPAQLKLFLLFEQQLKEEEIIVDNIRDTENVIAEFLLQRAHEMAFPKLKVSLFNKEQNIDNRIGMLEKEEAQRVYKEKEVEDEINYFAPYLAKLGNPKKLRYHKALDAKYACLNDFKQLLLDRAIRIQKTFESFTEKLQAKQNWYSVNHDSLLPEEEILHFEEVNKMIFYLHTLELRLTRHKELSSHRYDAVLAYLNIHPMLEVLH